MAESISIPAAADRRTIYEHLVPQIETLIGGEPDLVANLANVAAVLKEALPVLWVGFYLERDGELVLGPFQGPVACTRIAHGKGVCGHAFANGKTTIVPDVDKFPGHIACSSLSRSEIVVPIFGPSGSVFGVLDVDSIELDDFGEDDADGLNSIVRVIEGTIR